MEAVAIFSGISGSGTSTLLRALVLENPKFFRFMTIVTTRKPKPNDIQHPHNASWSEFCYVTDYLFDYWFERGELILPVADNVPEERYGYLFSTIKNVIKFDGCVVAKLPPTHHTSLNELFGKYQRSATGIFVDVEPDILYGRLRECGKTPDEARMHMRLGQNWPELAAELGYRFIQNPDEADRVPRKAIATAKQLIGLM